ncbi:MAG: type IV toxin-antitoxin system AbiEi family antitoxin domain-containing protein [Solirubrobacterales bacterium]
MAAELAGRQHGVVSRPQLLAAGLTSSGIDGWLRHGHLHRLHRGVYAVGHPRISQEGRWLAAVLTCGPGSFLSHGPAGQLLGLVNRRERFALHVSRRGRTGRSPAGIVTHHPRSLPLADTTVRLGIPVTTPTRTVWDLSASLSPAQLRRAFEQAEKFGLLERERLATLLAATPNHRGAGRLRELLAERSVPLSETRSWLEELALTACRDHGLPTPAVNVPLLGYEVDLLWMEAKFVVEADGDDHLSPAQRDRDNERDIALGRAGYLVRRYSSRAMSRSAEVAAEIAAILAERLRA